MADERIERLREAIVQSGAGWTPTTDVLDDLDAVENDVARIAELQAVLREARWVLNEQGLAMANTPSTWMRFLQAMDAALPDTEGPHRPNDGDDVPILCYVCGEVWPCPDTEGEQDG